MAKHRAEDKNPSSGLSTSQLNQATNASKVDRRTPDPKHEPKHETAGHDDH